MKLSSIDYTAAPKHIVLFGPPKSGKTKLALALSEFYNIKMLSLEAGHGVAKQFPIPWQERIDVISIPDTKAAPVGMAAILRLVRMGKIHPCVMHGIDTCAACVKNSGEFNSLILNELTKDDVLLLDTSTQLTFSTMAHIGRNAGEDWKPEFDDWGKLKNFMEMVFSFFQVAPFHFICVAHEELVRMEDKTTEKLVPTAGSSNFARLFAKYFDTVIYCEVKNGRHMFNSKTTYQNNILTGDRFNIDLNKEPEKGLLPLFQGGSLITNQSTSLLTKVK
jgi:hypothetical protein